MTIVEIVAAIMNYLTSGEGINNPRVPEDQVRAEVHATRVRMIQELLRQGMMLPQHCYSRFTVSFEQEQGTSFYEQVNPGQKKSAYIPRIVEHPLRLRPLVRYAGNAERSKKLRVLTATEEMYLSDEEHSTLFPKNVPSILINEEEARLFSESLEQVQVEAVVANPDDIVQDEEKELYPFSDELIDRLIGKITDRYARMFYRMQPLQKDGFRDTQGMEGGTKGEES
jgi:hypothetical protein